MAYGTTPAAMWVQLGYGNPRPGSREMGRITKAAAELAAADHALKDIARKREPGEPDPSREDVILAREVELLHKHRTYPGQYDANGFYIGSDPDEDDGFTPSAPHEEPPPDPGAGLEHLFEDAP